MDSQRLNAWLALGRADGVGPAAIRSLLEHFSGPQDIFVAADSALRAAGLSGDQIGALKRIDPDAVALDREWLDGSGRGLLTFDDPRYPPLLREIAAPPPVLFYQGDAELLRWPQLAIVGARSATPQGEQDARAFAAEFARRGVAITSGLALGIDGAAHRGALEAEGATIAVCATGLDRVYPARHQALAREIAAHGVLVSEFPIGVTARPDHFPRRNRIIAGLSLGVLVVEAARESGSLITARLAIEQGREVFAIPGSIHNPQARGCHALIRRGAKLVETVDDVFEELGPLLRGRIGTSLASQAVEKAPPAPPADATSADILSALGDELLDLDGLLARCGRSVAEVQAALTSLELTGEIACASGGRYQRIHR